MGAEVVRVAPSPTGFVHVGLLYMAVICKYIAKQSGGVFILRIEDTDREREVPGAKEEIVRQLNAFGLGYDEGEYIDEAGELKEKGDYGPYLQSERTDIYNSYLQHLIENDLAYKCYMTIEELGAMRNEQMENKVRPGVYGKFAKYHNANNPELVSSELYNEYQHLLKSDASYVVRFKSKGNMHSKFQMNDVIMGDVQVPENDEDFIVMKSDGHPSYHFAHVIDDKLMGTTLVIRGNEWFASLGKHIALWKAFGWSIPQYGHVAPINKQDGGTVRKLSKRKDNEADVKYFIEAGYQPEAVVAYLLRLANPSFDEYFTKQIHDKLNLINSLNGYYFNLSELARGGRGPLIDMPKLNNLSSEIIAQMPAQQLYKKYTQWLETHDVEFFNILSSNPEYTQKVLNIERTGEKIRKDIYNFEMIKGQIYYMFDTLVKPNRDSGYFPKEAKNMLCNLLVERDILSVNENGENMLELEVWVNTMKQICTDLGYEKFGDFMKALRIILTGEERTPNLYFLFNVLGSEKVKDRIMAE